MIGLTPFIVGMIRAPRSALTTASPARLAQKYEIPAATAAFYLDAWLRSPASDHRSK